MRQAGIIPDRTLAMRFAAYLLTLGITGRIDQEEQGFVIWVHDDRHLERSRTELASFLANPEAARYRDAEPQAEQIRRQQEALQHQYSRNVIDVRRRWRSWTEGHFPLTIGLIALSVVASLATDFGHNAFAYHWLYCVPLTEHNGGWAWEPAKGLQAVWHGQHWRLVTPALLNVGGWLHLILNMYWTYQFGGLIETRQGSLRLLVVVLATAICSNLAQFWWSGPSFGGMSGVGYGLFGYIWMKSRFDPRAGIFIPPGLVFQFLICLVLCMMPWFPMPVANAAHAFGLISGAAISYAPVLWRKMRPA